MKQMRVLWVIVMLSMLLIERDERVGWARPNAAATSGQTGVFMPPVTLSNSSYTTTNPSIFIHNNTVDVMWEQGTATIGNKDLFFTESADNGRVWSNPIAFYTSVKNSLRPDMALDMSGNVQVIWDEWTGSIRLTHHKPLKSGTAVTIEPSVNASASAHDIVVSSNNRIHVVFPGNKPGVEKTPFFPYYASRDVSGTTWLTATAVYTASIGTGSQYPSVTIDSQDNLHLVWQEQEAAADGRIFYAKGLNNSGVITWQTAVPIVTDPAITNAARPAIAIDENDTLHLVWENYISIGEQYLYYAHSTGGTAVQPGATTWSSPQPIVNGKVKANNSLPTYVSPKISLFNNTVYVLWIDSTQDIGGQEDVFLAYSDDLGVTWSSPVNVSRSANIQSLSPKMDVDTAGTIHIVWQEKAGGRYMVQYTQSAYGIFLPMVTRP